MAASPRSRSARAALVVIVVLLVGAFGLRLWNLNAPSVWHDEGWSIRAIRDPIHTPDDNTPPVYYSVIHLLWLGAGETPLALRYGSVLLDLLTIALAVRIMRRWAGWDAAILAAALLGVSPLLWAYAREVRAYVLVPLLALIVLWLADSLLAPRAVFPWRVWGGLLLAELALLYTHNLSVPVIAWLNLVVGGVWVWQQAWTRLAIWIAGQAALLVAYVPWLMGQSPSGTAINTPPALRPALVWDIWQAYFAPLPNMIGQERAVMIGGALFGFVALACAAALLVWNRHRRALLVLSQAVLLPALATVELLAANIDFHPRYYIAGVPAVLMVVALGVTSLPARFDLRRLAIPAVMALAWGVGAASLTALLDDPRYQHDDFRAIAEYYAGLPDDAIIVIPYGWEPAIEEYYADKVHIRAEILGIDLHSDASVAIGAINSALAARDDRPVHVELLTWFQLPADLRGMYPCLLESAGRPAGTGLTVQGLSTAGYRVERRLTLVDVPFSPVDYGVISLQQAAAGGQESVCVRTGWELDRRTDQDWRVAGRLLTTEPPGWIIARSDTDIRTAGQVPTSGWKVEEHGAGFSLLRFPAGTPPGDYAVQVIVFSQEQPGGLDRLVSGIPAGRILPLATVQPGGTTREPFEPPVPVAVDMGDGVQLAGHDTLPQTLDAGQELRITLYWQVMGDCCANHAWSGGTVSLRGDGWTRSQSVAAYATYSLDWHAFLIPADASGPVTLTVESGSIEPITLATVIIEQTDRLFTPPPFDVPVQTQFDDLAVLEGFSVAQMAITPHDTLDLTLVWRVVETPETSYRVFSHLLDADGRVIAQHDGVPVNDTRLTTGWVPGEYIADPHGLTFLPDRMDYRGPARLEVGFYDPETGRRVPVSQGADHIMLPIEITVQ